MEDTGGVDGNTRMKSKRVEEHANLSVCKELCKANDSLPFHQMCPLHVVDYILQDERLINELKGVAPLRTLEFDAEEGDKNEAHTPNTQSNSCSSDGYYSIKIVGRVLLTRNITFKRLLFKKGSRNTFGYAILIAKKWLAIRKDQKNECWYQNSIPEKLNDFNIGNFVADQEDKYKETATVYFVKRRKVTTTKVNIKI